MRRRRTRASRRDAPACTTTRTSRRGGASSTSCTHESRAKICLQLGHAGPKGSTQVAWDSAKTSPLDDGNWPLIAPSAVPYAPQCQMPREMTRADMDRVRDEFVRAGAHGRSRRLRHARAPLRARLSDVGFITPLSNRAPTNTAARSRTGSAFRSRCSARCARCGRRIGRCPCACPRPTGSRAASPATTRSPSRRRSSTPVWTSSTCPPARRRSGQAGLRPHVSDAVQRPDPQRDAHSHDRRRQHHGAEQVNAIIAAGRADLCALARPHLTDPFWTLRAAAQLGYERSPGRCNT